MRSQFYGAAKRRFAKNPLLDNRGQVSIIKPAKTISGFGLKANCKKLESQKRTMIHDGCVTHYVTVKISLLQMYAKPGFESFWYDFKNSLSVAEDFHSCKSCCVVVFLVCVTGGAHGSVRPQRRRLRVKPGLRSGSNTGYYRVAPLQRKTLLISVTGG